MEPWAFSTDKKERVIPQTPNQASAYRPLRSLPTLLHI
nr:MAG TPA: hypothetical protein [Caudoviricetes sp.]